MFDSGVLLVTGEHGTGKTSFALESCDPARMLFVDNDLKGRSTVRQVKADGVEFGRYVDMIARTEGKKAYDSHLVGLDVIESIGDDEFDGIVWDTWTEFASTCHAYVQTHPDAFRDPERWAAMGKIRSGEEYKEARLYEAELISRLQRKVPLVVLVSHLKNQYLNNAPTGKEIPAVSKAVDRVCNLRLWLRHNPNPAIHTPIGLVLKNIDRKVFDEEQRRLRTVQILPTKISPHPDERSLWDSINRYYRTPAGLREPYPEEIPNDFESSIVQGTLTEDQRLSWLTAMKQERDREAEEMLLSMEENRERVREMQESGMKYPQIAKEIGIPIGDVVRLLKEE